MQGSLRRDVPPHGRALRRLPYEVLSIEWRILELLYPALTLGIFLILSRVHATTSRVIHISHVVCVMSLDIHSPLSIRDQWAQYHVQQALVNTFNQFASSHNYGRPLEDHEDLPKPQRLELPTPDTATTSPRVCIIGAGAAGLFTALLFDHLNQNVPGFNIQYDIFESGNTDRVGGRLYTYSFTTTPHDYYDVGAMRFPDNRIMERYAEGSSA